MGMGDAPDAGALIDNSPEVVMVADGRGLIASANLTVQRLLGYRPDLLVGRAAEDLIHPDDRAVFSDVLEACAGRDESVGPTELRVVTSHGDWRHMALTVVALTPPGPAGTLGLYLRDVAPAIGPAGVASSPNRLRALVDSSDEITMLVDRDGVVQYASAAISRALGREPDSVVGTALADWVDDSHRPRVVDAIGEVLLDATEVRVEARLPDASGASRLLELYLVNRVDDPTVGGIIVNARDVTALRETMHLLDETQQQLFNFPFGVVLLDSRTNIVRANDAFCSLVGLDPERLEHRRFRELLHPDDQANVDLAMAEPRLDERIRIRLQRADGTVAGARLSLSAFHDFVGERFHLALLDEYPAPTADEQEDQTRTAELAYLATHDPLSGLPNRQLFEDRLRTALQRAERKRSLTAVLFCDLDFFKQVNDTHGHRVGDEFLVQVSRRLANMVRPGDTVARFGGDEFVVLAEDLENANSAAALAHRLVSVLSEPVELKGLVLKGTVSIGIALARTGVSPEELIGQADSAMYEAKRAGRAGVALHEPA
ncbi:MAG: hypothetical protein JJLCMIEE_03498 [Acidimicrobiales bacterium]|nr:MAG: diguanylate cyclase [Actinomycetota bacterium]MBV6510358.1 hypothetical protein [Acidimicrobiales bacterium]RIK03196.1 MAG: hypothetical protein DCC48_16925 [Acidobacteriota bacterium]